MADGLVRLLGSVQYARADGEDVALPSASMRRLLAVLALTPGYTLRAEHLVDLLDLSPGALRTSMSRLRARLDPGTVDTEASGYRLSCGVDAHRFARLLHDPGALDPLVAIDQALALWHGAAIEEFRHETWAEPEATRLDELRCVAIEDRAELLVARGRSGEAIADLEAHIATNPFRDRARALLIEALADDGRHADALRAFQQYRTFLAEESGTEPSPHVRSVEQRVAAGWSDLDVGSHAFGLH